MPVIRISDATWTRLQSHVTRPFEEKPEDVVNLALDALDEKRGRARAAPSEAPIARKRAAGKKLPQKQFRAPLMKVLLELGGSAHVSKIRSIMLSKMAPMLSDADYEMVSTGDPRWWNAICWERADLVREGLFAKDDERGVWSLTEKGKALAQ